MVQHDHLDVDVLLQSQVDALTSENPPPIDSQFGAPLCDIVASGRLYVLNGKGEFEQVLSASYWKENAILTVCSDGYEYDESGDVTRDWRVKAGG